MPGIERRQRCSEPLCFEHFQRGWLGLWEVLSVETGVGMQARELLTGLERYFWERQATHQLQVGMVVLIRLVELEPTISVMAGCYPAILNLDWAERVRQVVMKELFPRRRKLKPAELIHEEAFLELTWAYDDAVRAASEQPPPQMENFHGEPIRWTVDHFDFSSTAGPAVVAALTSEFGELLDRAIAVTEDSKRGSVTVAFLRVGDTHLQCETNSLARADRLKDRLSHITLLRFNRREHPSGPQLPAAPAEPPGPEAQAFLREYRLKLMRTWLDDSIPALGGKTPRQAAGTAQRRKQLLALLKSFAVSEARMPAEKRISLSFLYAELGLAEP